MYNILFIDSDKTTLAGFRRQMQLHKAKWNSFFATDHSEAINIINENNIDILVCNTCNPDKHGMDFLGRVSEMKPGIVRILLTSELNSEKAIQCISIAHQVFTKPSKIMDMLLDIEKYIDSLKNVFSDDLKKTFNLTKKLPSFPSSIAVIQNELNKENYNLKNIARIINDDPSLSTGLLRLVNSPFFGIKTTVVDPLQALNFLGFETVKAFIISNYLYSHYKVKNTDDFNFENLKRHSSTVANFASIIARELGFKASVVEEAHSAGILHDIGKIILYAEHYSYYNELVKEAKSKNVPLWELEETQIGLNHADIGGYLFLLWGFPQNLVDAIRFHHMPNLYPGIENQVLTCLHMANVLEHNLININNDRPQRFYADSYLTRAGITTEILEDVSMSVEKYLNTQTTELT